LHFETILLLNLQDAMCMKSRITVLFVFFSFGLVNAFVFSKANGISATQFAPQTGDTIPKRNLHGKGRRINPYPIILQKFFTRVWSGNTTCNGDEGKSPSVLTITGKDSVDVYVSGLLHSKAKVVGAIRGYMIIIEPQKIHSSKGEHLVEGNFILSNDFNSLTGNYTSKLKGKTDTCTVVYHPQQ
jgi:hypothetical protein